MEQRRRPHPFRELRRRGHIFFAIDEVADAAGGALYARRGEHAVIIVSPDLTPEDRSSHLAHELVHDDIGVVQPPATDATMERIEEMVDRRTASWLVPADELQALVDARAEVEPITAGLVAEEFGVSVEVADRALRRLQVDLMERELAAAARQPAPRFRIVDLASFELGEPVNRPSPPPEDG